MPKKSQTNVEFIVDMMEHSRFGGLVQAFVLEGVARYANQCVSNAKSLRKSMKNHMVHPEAWIGVATEVQKKCNESEVAFGRSPTSLNLMLSIPELPDYMI
jgi:hypothetical protein